MNARKIILIFVALLLVIYFLLEVITPDSLMSNNFSASYPEVFDNAGNPKKIDVVADFSGSMKGYIDYSGISEQVDNSIFISAVSDFLTDYESQSSGGKAVVHCGDKKYDKDDFREKLRNKKIFHGGTTELDVLIDKACSFASDTSVSVLLSDMVMSYGVNVIKNSKDPHYNLTQLNGLASAIKSKVVAIKDKDLHIMLVQYLCDFKGDYYYNYLENLPSGKSAFKGTLMRNRPFYMMLIGKKDYLVSLYNKCMAEGNKVYTSFDITEGGVNNSYEIEETDGMSYWNKGETPLEEAGTFWTDLSGLDNTRMTFSVKYPNFILPKYIKNDNIQVNASAGVAVLRKNYDSATKTLAFTVETPAFDSMKKKTAVEFSVFCNTMGGWDAVSVKDDVNVTLADLEGKTWSIKPVVDAINAAYYGNSERNADVKISSSEITFIKK